MEKMRRRMFLGTALIGVAATVHGNDRPEPEPLTEADWKAIAWGKTAAGLEAGLQLVAGLERDRLREGRCRYEVFAGTRVIVELFAKWQLRHSGSAFLREVRNHYVKADCRVRHAPLNVKRGVWIGLGGKYGKKSQSADGAMT